MKSVTAWTAPWMSGGISFLYNRQDQKEPAARLPCLLHFPDQLQHCPEVRLDRVQDAPNLNAFRQWFI